MPRIVVPLSLLLLLLLSGWSEAVPWPKSVDLRGVWPAARADGDGQRELTDADLHEIVMELHIESEARRQLAAAQEREAALREAAHEREAALREAAREREAALAARLQQERGAAEWLQRQQDRRQVGFLAVVVAVALVATSAALLAAGAARRSSTGTGNASSGAVTVVHAGPRPLRPTPVVPAALLGRGMLGRGIPRAAAEGPGPLCRDPAPAPRAPGPGPGRAGSGSGSDSPRLSHLDDLDRLAEVDGVEYADLDFGMLEDQEV